jgi:hypothetical protein
MSAKYVVMNEHTLGYIGLSAGEEQMAVLFGSIFKGGYDWKYGPVLTFGKTLRPATVEDFKEYRVSIPSDFQS